VTDPVMLELDATTSALLLPNTDVARFRDRHSPANAPPGLVPMTLFVSSDAPATFEAAGVKVTVGPKGEWLSLRATRHVFAFRTAGTSLIGGLRVPLGGWAEVHLSAHSLEVSEHEP